MEVDYLQEYLSTHQSDLVRDVLAEKYLPDAIRRVEIPKLNDERKIPKGECLGDIQLSEPEGGWVWRLLGIPP